MTNANDLINNIPRDELLEQIQNCLMLNVSPNLSKKDLQFVIARLLLDSENESILKADVNKILGINVSSYPKEFNIYLTHDIDWLYPHHIYSFLKFARNKIMGTDWLTFSQLKQSELFLRNVEKLVDLEKKLNISSIFFIGAQQKRQTLGRYDIRYNVENTQYKSLLEILVNSRIGLHSSYTSYKKQNYKTEAESLRRTTNQKIIYHRSHFLKMDSTSFWHNLEVAGIKYDFGIGYARTVGFRNGITTPYKGIDLIKQTTSSIIEIPLILMDNAFFYHSRSKVIADFTICLQQVKEYNGSVCVLFHPENMILKPELWDIYEEVISICKQTGAQITPRLN